MERESQNGSPESSLPLGREIYITPQQLALAAIVDAIDKRVLNKLKQGEADEQTDTQELPQ